MTFTIKQSNKKYTYEKIVVNILAYNYVHTTTTLLKNLT